MPRTGKREAHAVVEQGHNRLNERACWAYIRAPFGELGATVPHETLVADTAWVDIDEDGRVIGVRVDFRSDAERV